MELKLGWCQGYMALKYHMEEALAENMLDTNNANWCPPIAIFSKKYYNEINELDYKKKYDFCFIGSINSNYELRKWCIEFVKKNFTSNSIFVNTDNDPNWELLGDFDYSNKNLGYCPKLAGYPENQSKQVQYRVIQENLFYFETMRQSNFVLCPAGDAPWSFRFYEILMCKSIPIVESWHHTYRTKEESELKYKYLLFNNIEETLNIENSTYNDLVNANTSIFETFHMLQ